VPRIDRTPRPAASPLAAPAAPPPTPPRAGRPAADALAPRGPAAPAAPRGDAPDPAAIGRGAGRRVRLADDPAGGPAIEVGASGRFLSGGRLLAETPGAGEDGALLDRLARRAATGSVLGPA
jgi:hypothetical protein